MQTARWIMVTMTVLAGSACRSGSTAERASDVGEGPSPTGENVVLFVGPDESTERYRDPTWGAPALVVAADGRVVYPAPGEFAGDGEFMENLWVQRIDAAGLDTVRQSIGTDDEPVSIGELTALVAPGALGVVEDFLPDSYRFEAIDVAEAGVVGDVDTPIVEWPETASIGLAEATSCRELPELEVGEVFETAAADSVFADDGRLYAVIARPTLPGSTCG